MKGIIMKTLISLLVVLVISCTNGQVRSDYRINFDQHPQAAKYLIFLEERNQATGFMLQDSVDYLEPNNLSNLKIAETTSAVPITIRLLNDGKYIRAGIVVEDSAGYYSVMGVSAIFRKGSIPDKPSLITISKVP